MSEKSDKELLETLGVELYEKKKFKYTSKEENVIACFEEIQNFYKNFKRIPENKEGREIFERIYSLRLTAIKKDKQLINLLSSFDHQNLLIDPNLLLTQDDEDNLDDTELLSKLGLHSEQNDFTDLRYVRSYEERRIAEEFANREKCLNFESFKPLFEKIQKEIENGTKKTIPLQGRPVINKGSFFILNGLKTYVAEVGETFIQEYGIKDARLYLIFDNGTESRMLMRSLQKVLTMDSSSRIISETNLGPLFSQSTQEGDQFTGTIYVLRSYSKIPFIVENQNLIHKIGFTTTTIKKRIASAKTDPTFLLAEVEVVDSYKLFNIKSSKFENLIQKIFSKSKLDIEIIDRFGNPFKPDEWFLVPLDIIKEAIQKIIDGTITKYIYEPALAKMVEIKIDN